MGFKCVAVAEPYAALLEHGTDTLEDYLGGYAPSLAPAKARTAVLLS